MPIYEYECESCGTRLEAIQRFDDPPLETCDCGDQGKLRKLISAPAFQFKGDGWYVTDYARKDGNGKEAKGEGQKEDKGTEAKGKESGGKETKSAAGAEKSGTSSKAT